MAAISAIGLSAEWLFQGIIGTYIAVETLTDLEEISQKLAAEIRVRVEACTETSERHDHHLYVLKDSDQNVRYVGRTKDPARRLTQHQNDPKHPERQLYTMTVVAAGLTEKEAMFGEQVLISAYTLAYLDNARREIAVKNLSNYEQNIRYAMDIISGYTEDVWMSMLGG